MTNSPDAPLQLVFQHRYRKDMKISPGESQLTAGKVSSYFLFKQQPSLWSLFWNRLFDIYEEKIRSSSSVEALESSFPIPDKTWTCRELRPKCHAQKMYIFLYCPRKVVGLLLWMLAIGNTFRAFLFRLSKRNTCLLSYLLCLHHTNMN